MLPSRRRSLAKSRGSIRPFSEYDGYLGRLGAHPVRDPADERLGDEGSLEGRQQKLPSLNKEGRERKRRGGYQIPAGGVTRSRRCGSRISPEVVRGAAMPLTGLRSEALMHQLLMEQISSECL